MGLISKFFNGLFGLVVKLADKCHLPIVKDVDGEIRKINIIRIIIGLLIFARYAELAYIYQFAEASTNYYMLLGFCGISLLWAAGLLTPILSIVIILTAQYIETKVGSVTLGTAILMQLFILMTVSKANGLKYSLDNYFIKKRPNGLISRLYQLIGQPSKEWLRVAYFLAFMSYAIVSLVALSYHLMDRFWVNGYTFQVLATSSYLCKYYDFFRWIEASVPGFIRVFSIMAIIGQSLFQFFMIPLMFWKPGRYFVEVWGWIFFINSLVLIQLSYLPHIELCFWWLLFVPGTRPQVKLLFEATNKSGRRLANYIKSVSSGQSVELETSSFTDKKLIILVDDEKLIGLSRLIFIWRKVLISTVIFPITKILSILSPSTKTPITYPANPFSRLSFGKKAIILTYLLFWSVYFPLRLPFVSYKFKAFVHDILHSPTLYGKMEKAVLNFGLDCPIVFNESDLSMSNRWAVLYYLDENGEKQRVPMTGIDGNRENIFNWDYLWFSNHNSDKLYFGNSLKFRRGIRKIKTQEGLEKWNSGGGVGNYIMFYRATILKKVYGIQSNRFWVEVYENQSSNVNAPPEEKYNAKKLLEYPINL